MSGCASTTAPSSMATPNFIPTSPAGWSARTLALGPDRFGTTEIRHPEALPDDDPVLRLRFFYRARHTLLTTDASETAISAVLTQPDDEGHHHPIAYESSKLTAAEQGYLSYVLELLAAVHVLRVFRHYLLGTQHCGVSSSSALSAGGFLGLHAPDGQSGGLVASHEFQHHPLPSALARPDRLGGNPLRRGECPGPPGPCRSADTQLFSPGHGRRFAPGAGTTTTAGLARTTTAATVVSPGPAVAADPGPGPAVKAGPLPNFLKTAAAAVVGHGSAAAAGLALVQDLDSLGGLGGRRLHHASVYVARRRTGAPNLGPQLCRCMEPA